MKSQSKTGSQNGTKSNKASNSTGMESSQLMKLFEDELKDIYWAEKALTKAIPKMIKNASDALLIKVLKGHLDETETHVKRAEKVFAILGKKATAKKCEAMAGLIKEAEEIMKDCDAGAMRDAGIISAGQKVEHYEIASYGILRQFAETLDLKDAEKLFGQTLQEEKMADMKLTEAAVSAINVRAARKEEA